jgi:hypothetical protein
MRMQAAAVAVAGVLMLGVAGCASTSQAGSGGPVTGSGGVIGTTLPSDTTTGPSIGGPASSPAPTSSVARAAAAACPTDSVTPVSNPRAKPVTADLQVAWVLRCRLISTNGSYSLIAERSVSDPTDLVRALRKPTMPRQKVVCPMIAVYIPNFALVEPDGQLLFPKVPLNNCGMAQVDVVAALNLMKFVQISSRPVR